MVDKGLAQGTKTLGGVVLKCTGAIFFLDNRRQLAQDFHRETSRGWDAAGQRNHPRLSHHFQDFANGVDTHRGRTWGQQMIKVHSCSFPSCVQITHCRIQHQIELFFAPLSLCALALAFADPKSLIPHAAQSQHCRRP